MAKKRHAARNVRRRDQSYMTSSSIYLHPHDEDKVLLFATGIILGVGISATILGAYIYGGAVLVIMALVFLLLEHRHATIHTVARRR